jgi:hypothetical protein
VDGGNGVQGIKVEVKGKVRINSDQEFVEQVRESALLCVGEQSLKNSWEKCDEDVGFRARYWQARAWGCAAIKSTCAA